MTRPLSSRGARGSFGGLRSGTSKAIQDPTSLLVSRNTQHVDDGNIEPRYGTALHSEVAEVSQLKCAPTLTANTTGTGALRPDVTYYVRYTYVTAAGETDDGWKEPNKSIDLTTTPAESSVKLNSTQNSILVEVPMHMRGLTISQYRFVNETTVQFQVDQQINNPCSNAIFRDWIVYSRSPIIQDETHLGFNCNAADPLYHRRESASDGKLGYITAYDGTWFTLSTTKSFGLTGFPDHDTIDIMMPDRGGLPVRYAAIYISTDRVNFHYTNVAVDGINDVVVIEHDETQKVSPTQRVPRGAPTLTAIDAAEKKEGLCGEHVTSTGLEAGVYAVRYTWKFDDPDVMRPPGLEDAQRLLGEPIDCYPWKALQETWPSCVSYIGINEGQGIRVEPPEFPDGYIDWNIYVEKLVPDLESDFTGTTRASNQAGGGNPEAENAAWYSGDSDLADTAVEALVAANYDNHPASKRNQPQGYDEYADWSAIVINNDDPFDTSTRGYPPAYKDLYDGFYLDTDNVEEFLFASSRDASSIATSNHHYWFYFPSGTPSYSHITLKLRMRTRAGNANAWRGSLSDDLSIRIWNEGLSQWEELEANVDHTGDFNWYGWTLDFDTSYLYNHTGAEHYLIFDILGQNYNGFDVDYIGIEGYDVSSCCGEQLREVKFHDHSWRRDQRFGVSAPELVGAYYSGDNDWSDQEVNANQTYAQASTLDPDLSRDALMAATGQTYDEYRDQSSFVDYQDFPASLRTFDGSDNIYLNGFTTYQNTIVYDTVLGPGAGNYTQGVDWDWDLTAITYSANVHGTEGRIVRLGGGSIPAGATVGVRWEGLNILNLLKDPTAAAGTNKGWAPGYHDIFDPELKWHYAPNDEDVGPELYVSSRDGDGSEVNVPGENESVEVNRHHWWFEANDGAVSTDSWLIITVRFRARPGGSGWLSTADTNRKIRIWRENSSNYLDLETGIDSTTYANFTTRRYALDYNTAQLYRITYTPDAADPYGTSARKYLVVDFLAGDHNGFDVADVSVEWICDYEQPELNKHTLKVDRVPYGTESWDIVNPIPIKPRVEHCAATCPDQEVDIIQGEWCHIRANTTAQWPVHQKSLEVVEGAGNSAAGLELMVGCADSVFVEGERGSLERIYHEEGTYHAKVMRYHWRFANYLSRIFFCNTGQNRWNFRYDGVQTHPMGLPWPASPLDEASGNVAENNDYDPYSDNDIGDSGIGLTDDGCSIIGEQPIVEASEIDIRQIEDGCSTIPEGSADPVRCHDVEYRLAYLRILKTPGRGYVIWSRPRLLTETVEVKQHPDFEPEVSFETYLCPEPQATHMAVYRNQKFTASYFLVDLIKIDESVLDETEGKVRLSVVDSIPSFDEDLGLPMYLETGRPRPSRFMVQHANRMWMAPQEMGDGCDISNVSSPQGSADPEGWWPLHFLDLPMPEKAAVTCFVPYNDVMTIHSRQGLVYGLSNGQANDPSDIDLNPTASHIGFIGPDAWVKANQKLIGMTHEGVGIVQGGEVNVIGGSDLDFSEYDWSEENGFLTKGVYYHTKGIQQIIFSIAKNPFGRFDGCLVLDEGQKLLWKEWTEMPAWGLSRARGVCGDEHPLFGGTDGRLYTYGEWVSTDCGLLIETDMMTTWFDEINVQRSHQPRMNYWELEGDIDEYLRVDTYKDGERVAFNSKDVYIYAGGSSSVTDDCNAERKLWTDDFQFDFDDVWPDEDKDWDKQRTNHRGWFDRIAYRLYRTRDTLRIGVHPSVRWKLSGVIYFHRLGGPRMQNAGG